MPNFGTPSLGYKDKNKKSLSGQMIGKLKHAKGLWAFELAYAYRFGHK